MFGSCGRWWRDGEGSALGIYRYSWHRTALGLLAGVGVVIFFVAKAGEREIFVLPIFLWAAARCIGEVRRVVILTEDSLIYRPPFGRAVCVRLNKVQTAMRVQLVTTVMLRLSRVPGLKLTLENREIVSVPLDLPDAPEVLDRLKIKLAGRARF